MSQISIEQEIKKSYLEYSLSVIVGRAIPDVRDGLKPVHRRILYAMHELSNSWNRPYKKSARVVGDVIGKYHPHGDSAVYDALVRMAQDFSMRDPLVDGQGNFGSIDGDAAAAMRYTEVRMARLTAEFLGDIDKDTVNWRANYDNSLQEPVVLPTKVPNLLLNGSAGIAVGMATNIPPHNLGELVDGTIHLLDNPDCTIGDLTAFIKGPDFPTAASLYGGRGLADAYATGRGTIRIRGTAEIEEAKNGRQSIVITEIPYAVNKSTLVEKIAQLVNDRKIEGVSDLRDESDRKGIRIVIDLKKGSIAEIIVNSLYKYTQLETSFGINMMAVVDNRPMLLNIKQILEHFLRHRREVILRRTRFDLDKAEKRAHILEGLRIAVDNIDEVVQLIKTSASPVEAKSRLMERFELSEIQSQAILDMRLQRLTGLEHEKLLEEYRELIKRIEYLNSILKSDEVLKGVIRDELAEIRKTFATPRRTVIIEQDPDAIDIEDLIADEDVVITFTRRGYIKRVPLDSYQQQRRGGKGIAGTATSEGDMLHSLLTTSNHQSLLLFTNQGRMHQLKVHRVPEGSRYAKGAHIANLIPLEKDEYVATALSVRDFAEDRFFLFVTKRGMVKRTLASLYRNVRSSGIKAVLLRDDDELIMVRQIDQTDEVVLCTREGTAIRFSVTEVRPMGRTASGVKGIALRGNDMVMGAVIVPPQKEGEPDETWGHILTVAERGYGKRTAVGQYRLQSRGGRGVINMKLTQKTGKVLGAILVQDDDQLVMMTSANKVIRIGVRDVSVVGRATQGVRLAALDNGGVLAAFDLVREDYPLDVVPE
ncbi:DNA gyrase subunit A [Alkalidesulfovibrio alkalitolerans DSM 16529]|uniref:DNA gyrase subunit A n=1 Tax=Alkalidesulfovibrio alkalitolerans DSM 16529 TaxID=1121439 RepID=S7TB88_9BACT|nr:DNA gyrase subunit A [Alkalidesulfovibrio alkalitolerans]EPR34417.1 DNA gyrase subunit A [Alkalidesulfovibrio alkalitolerans DSM 16529]